MPNQDVPFQKLVEYAPAGIFHSDPNGHITYANEHWFALFGLSHNQHHPENWLDAIDNEHIQALRDEWISCIHHRQSFHFEAKLKPQAGLTKFIRIDANPITNNSQLIGYVGHIKDITLRSQQELQLKKSNDLAKNLIEQSRIPYAVRESDDHISYINPAFTQVFGYKLEDIRTTEQWYEKAYPNERYRNAVKRDWDIYLNKLEANHKIATLEARIRCKDGSIKTILVSPSKLLGTCEDQFSVSFYDISELKMAQVALEQSQERFALAVKGSGVGIWDWNIENGHVFFAPELIQELGYEQDEFSNTINSFYQYIHPSDKQKVEQAFINHLSAKNIPYFIKYRMRHKDGQYHWYQGVGQALKADNGHAYRMAGSHTNISQQMLNHDELTLAKMVFDHSGEAIITTNVNGKIQATNPAFNLITGFDKYELIDCNIIKIKSERNSVDIVTNVRHDLMKNGVWSGEVWCITKNKGDIAISVVINAIKNNKGETQKFIALFTDITEKKNNQEIIWQQAHYDNLTHLLNRNSFTKYIDNTVKSKHAFALLFIDLDHFKRVNDTLGHNVGDELLIQAALRIKHCIRHSDVVSRFGGDEFTVALSGQLNDQIINRICSQIIESLSAPYDLNGEVTYISASIGITQFPQDSQDVETLYKYADQAMYDAKHNGRNRYAFFTEALQIAANYHREVTSDLRHALDNNELYVLYQPIINLNTNKIYKAEALLRWQHPKRGLISPIEFIPLAEETGLINEIGDWVFKQAAMQAKILRKKTSTNVQISINKSPVQFHSDHETGHALWSEFLKTINLDGSAIAVEITEGLLLESTEMVKNKLIDFRNNNMAVSLDDFGTGYSALSYLKRFDIDYIKIDRGFVKNIEDDNYNRILCETIIGMAHKLGMEVIAEGIENEQQRQILLNAKCDYGQGYLFSKPITAVELIRLIEQSHL
jgi:diguanylate cyclase (GGDEF)-like protein/PAS domain S-box-containing protein